MRAAARVTSRRGHARAVCWSTAVDMLREAELSLPAFVRMLAGAMGQEASLSVLQTCIRSPAR
jgi:hypothetical protein